MDDTILLVVYWIIEGTPIIFQRGWSPIAIENLDTCVQRGIAVLDYISGSGLAELAGAEEVRVHCGTLNDHVQWLEQNYPTEQ